MNEKSERYHIFRADLHTHTNNSDGKLSAEELLKEAHEIGLSALSITDHDTVGAYTKTVFAYAETLGVHLLPGIEISSFFNGESIHVLGYGIDVNSKPLLELIARLKKRREDRNRAILQKLQNHAIFIDENELPDIRSAGRPHIADRMMQKGYVTSIAEAFKKYLGDGKPAYVKGDEVPTELAIETIHKAGGAAVLAHPHLIKRKRTIKKLLELPFDGIECYYGSLAKDKENGFVQLAEERGLLKTGGSDFHGLDGRHTSLGRSWTQEDDFYALRNRSN